MKIMGSKSSDETQSLAMCIWVLPIEGILWPPKDLADVEQWPIGGCLNFLAASTNILRP